MATKIKSIPVLTGEVGENFIKKARKSFKKHTLDSLLNEITEDEQNECDKKMIAQISENKQIAVKIICERKDGEITTWYDILETSVEDIINKVKYNKGWIHGNITEVYLEFYAYQESYKKVYLNVFRNEYNKLLLH